MRQGTHSKKTVVKETVNIYKRLIGKMEDLVKGYCVAAPGYRV